MGARLGGSTKSGVDMGILMGESVDIRDGWDTGFIKGITMGAHVGTCAGTRLGRRELLGEKLGFAVCKPREGCALDVQGTFMGTPEGIPLVYQDGTAEETRSG